ncbi:MAG TPA: tripartite tricarboxylate transporter permease [Candidatus Methylomirabilis sp.]|nr:tripartite tricarboxylate transporter permease [Candidatus Methylomirabilis sp.]HSC70487.1 tripartite tricarboxylate transporter permease [Candidatus Methylomirabilis sp.]
METLHSLGQGLLVALTPLNLLYCFLGVLWGTLVGILPGIGPLGGIALLLPMTFKMSATSAIIMLAGIFYGAMYGGSTTSILLNIPGEAASVVTCLDGYKMARQGRAGPALVISALGSFFAGTVSVGVLMLFAPTLAKAMLKIGPGEEFSLMLLALVVLSFVSQAPVEKTVPMIVLGLCLATIGMDPFTGYMRYTFGYAGFAEGLGFVPMVIGLFGVSEILMNLEHVASVQAIKPTLRSLIPRWKDLRDSAGPVARGTLIGILFGFVPGISHVVSTFMSYAVEKKISRHPEEFGSGRIEGVAGPEAANNATTGSSLVPLLVLGIPAIPATALLMTALLVHGVNPGPQLIHEHPEVFWGLIASMYVGNVMLLVLNLPMVGLFVNLLRIRYVYLVPSILVISVCGVWGVNASPVDIVLMAVFGVIGYLLRKFKFDLSPLVLAVVLGDRMEMSFRRALTISEGSLWIFVKSSFSQIFLGALVIIALLQATAWYLGFRVQPPREEG